MLLVHTESSIGTPTGAHRGIVISCRDVQGLFMRLSNADESVIVASAIRHRDPVTGISKPVVAR